MKKIILILSVFLGLTQYSFAQDSDREEQWERIKALKVAFFTQELKLDDKMAEKFWPIYNQFEKKRYELHKRENIDLDNVECINETEANEILNEFLVVENEEYKNKKQLFKDLKDIMTAKDIIKLYKLEDEFHKKLIKEYRSKSDRKDPNSSK